MDTTIAVLILFAVFGAFLVCKAYRPNWSGPRKVRDGAAGT